MANCSHDPILNLPAINLRALDLPIFSIGGAFNGLNLRLNSFFDKLVPISPCISSS